MIKYDFCILCMDVGMHIQFDFIVSSTILDKNGYKDGREKHLREELGIRLS